VNISANCVIMFFGRFLSAVFNVLSCPDALRLAVCFKCLKLVSEWCRFPM